LIKKKEVIIGLGTENLFHVQSIDLANRFVACCCFMEGLYVRTRIRPLIIIDSANAHVGTFLPEHFTVSLS